LRNNLSHRLHFRSLEINIENFGKSLQHESDLQKVLNAKKKKKKLKKKKKKKQNKKKKKKKKKKNKKN